MNKFLIFLLAAPLMAQTTAAPVPVPAAPPTAPEQLNSLEKAGLAQIVQEYQKVLNDLSNANIDIAKSHPGYQLDPKNPLSGVLVKVEKKEAPKAVPAK